MVARSAAAAKRPRSIPDWGEPGLTAGREDLRLEQLHRAGDGVRPAGEPGERRGAERAGALPDPLHCGHRSGRLRGRAAAASGRRRLPRGPDRECRHPHAGQPDRSAIPGCGWAGVSMERSMGKRVQVIPNSSGGLPGDVFVDHLGVPLVWVPHSYNGCKQHGPDEHFLSRAGARGHRGLRRHLVGSGRAWHAVNDGVGAARRASPPSVTFYAPARMAVTIASHLVLLLERSRFVSHSIKTAVLAAPLGAVALPALAQPASSPASRRLRAARPWRAMSSSKRHQPRRAAPPGGSWARPDHPLQRSRRGPTTVR